MCGPAQIHKIAELLKKTLEKKEKTLLITKNIRCEDPENQQLEDFESVCDAADKQMPNQAFVRVMRGCDRFCSYCIVPYVRGPEVSRPPKAVIEQIKKLADKGVKVVTLLGQTVNSYCYVAGEKTYCLAELLEMASEISGIEWIRFVTSYPSEKFFEPICRAMAGMEKVCKYLHIPAQSGSDRILKAMNRKYTAEKYLELAAVARDIVPDIAIAGDFIVGFPGETEEDFQATVNLVQRVRYKNCFVFRYSPRPKTAAERMAADNVPQEIKKQRNSRLLAVQEQISGELAGGFQNKIINVFVEGLSKKSHLNAGGENNPQLTARNGQDWIVVFNGPAELTGSFTTVKITKTSPLTLFGEPAG